MSIQTLKQSLIERVPGVSGLIMQYEPGTGRQIFTATVEGKNVQAIVDPAVADQVIIDAITETLKQAGVSQ